MHKANIELWQHHHVFNPVKKESERKTLFVVIITVLMMITEILAGWWFKSMALFADAMTSVLAIVALLGAKFMHWNFLDPFMGIVGAILILRWTYFLLKDSGSVLLDRELNAHLIYKIHAGNIYSTIVGYPI